LRRLMSAVAHVAKSRKSHGEFDGRALPRLLEQTGLRPRRQQAGLSRRAQNVSFKKMHAMAYMNFAEMMLLSAAGGAVAALAPLVYIFYVARRATFTTWTGALVSFIAGFVLTLLLQQWHLFYARFTYLLAVSLLAVSIAYTWWGMWTRRWSLYLFAAAAWVYIILLAVVARALGLGDPFLV